ncbi:MAG: 50S ribosomal protein L9 [Holosporales bacterium]|jgi:large subunit ribosomal protein L9|nr:50S ribosomal protein L9 [Holosporales bacterium]
MKVILLERIEKLGFIGDIADVKSGFARNFLLPQKKALRSTAANLDYFATKKAEIEANNLKLKEGAEKVASKMTDVSLILVRNASESGMLFGSIRGNDICESLADKGFKISKSQVKMASPIKTIGNHVVTIVLHPEVTVNVGIRVITVQEQEIDTKLSTTEATQGENDNQATEA